MSNMSIAQLRGRFGCVETIGDLDKTTWSNLRKQEVRKEVKQNCYEFAVSGERRQLLKRFAGSRRVLLVILVLFSVFSGCFHVG